MANNTKNKGSQKQGNGGKKTTSGSGKRGSAKSAKAGSGTSRADYEDEPRPAK